MPKIHDILVSRQRRLILNLRMLLRLLLDFHADPKVPGLILSLRLQIPRSFRSLLPHIIIPLHIPIICRPNRLRRIPLPRQHLLHEPLRASRMLVQVLRNAGSPCVDALGYRGFDGFQAVAGQRFRGLPVDGDFRERGELLEGLVVEVEEMWAWTAVGVDAGEAGRGANVEEFDARRALDFGEQPGCKPHV